MELDELKLELPGNELEKLELETSDSELDKLELELEFSTPSNQAKPSAFGSVRE